MLNRLLAPFLFLLSHCLSFQEVMSSKLEEDKERKIPQASTFFSPNIKIGDRAQRNESTAYIECYSANEFLELGFANFSFNIIAKEGTTHKGIQVGTIAVRYSQKASVASVLDKAVEIGFLEVKSQYRGNGYGEAAIRTVIGVFRSPKRSQLDFDRFWLSVGLDENREIARTLYSKIGFKVEEVNKDIGYQSMVLMR